MSDNRTQTTKGNHLGARCMKKCFAADWEEYRPPGKNGDVGTLRCQFNIESPAFNVISYQLYMVFVVKKRTKGDETLNWYAEVVSPFEPEKNLLASQRWPDSLESALDWARMVVALHEAEHPLQGRTYG